MLLLLAGGLVADVSAQARDAAGVLSDMRQAMGGAAALDALKTFSARGSRTLNTPMGSHRLDLEWFATWPDHFLEIRRDSPSGPVAINIVYYSGLAASRVIQKTHATGLNFPETKYVDNSPAAIAARERIGLLRQARIYARILLIFTGASADVYPFQFSYGGIEQAEGKSYELVDATGPDGFKCRLHVDAATKLPAMLTWVDELPSIVSTTTVETFTTTSVVRVPSGSMPPPTLPPPPPPMPAPTSAQAAPNRGSAPKRWLFRDFKVQDGIKWPRVIDEEFDGKKEEIRLGSVKINPKIDPRRFDIK